MQLTKTVAITLQAHGITRRHLLLASAAVGAAMLTALAAHVRIPLPFSPVPVTSQTMVVLLAGAFLGPYAGSLSQALFIGLGTAGLASFAGGALSGVTGGYIVGFVLAAALVGAVARRTSSIVAVGAAMVAGNALLLTTGAAWLAIVMNLSAAEAVALGIVPFLPGDIFKLAAALMIWRAAAGTWKRITGETAAP